MTSILRWSALRAMLQALAALPLLIACPAASWAQRPADGWVLLHSIGVKVGTQLVTLPPATPRTTAVRLRAKGGALELASVVVTYGNGQVHFETRPNDAPIALAPDAETPPIDQRQEDRAVESISLEVRKAPADAVIEVWGLVAKGAAAQETARSVQTRAVRSVKTEPAQAKRYIEVPVLFGTTRQREKDRVKGGATLATFSGEQAKDLTLGRSIVTVPLERERGTIPRPSGVTAIVGRITFRNEDPNRDFTIAAVDVLGKPEFLADVRSQLAVAQRFKGQALVFVHGYNVSFDDALFRTAQIAHDIGFDGPALSFSWPSRGATLDYIHDLNTAKASREALRIFLETVANETGVSAVNVVAHSMGSDPVLEVLKAHADIVALKGAATDLKLNELVLAAPDVSRDVFEQFAGKIVPIARGGITLFATNADLAMLASKRASRGVVRAGDVPPEGIVIVPGVESIDVSQASLGFFSLNHSLFADREQLISDMAKLFELSSNKHPPDVRAAGVYLTEGAQPKKWWRFVKR